MKADCLHPRCRRYERHIRQGDEEGEYCHIHAFVWEELRRDGERVLPRPNCPEGREAGE